MLTKMPIPFPLDRRAAGAPVQPLAADVAHHVAAHARELVAAAVLDEGEGAAGTGAFERAGAGRFDRGAQGEAGALVAGVRVVPGFEAAEAGGAQAGGGGAGEAEGEVVQAGEAGEGVGEEEAGAGEVGVGEEREVGVEGEEGEEDDAG